ncbi:hypothetical protein N7519_003509 [Penicillium mononematosum]|uniref:uncharacterized protein n=1 Tax=Penicillium mononematosum TaxID=268346 RepID=UPI0025480F14|nr:uncharacterized protein N7519_003509 [Penicillium mononematosum]KAJ6160141.1 hypothetical protein N7497_004678 [Penicillium chrysogenum]KAJ6188601.1 hypothetical protein N7519_003509 [Penicillium mononematosum]
MTENEKTNCRLCEKIETKYRRRSAEVDRLDRWKREGATLVASMDRSHKLIMDLEKRDPLPAAGAGRPKEHSPKIGLQLC